MNEYSQEVGHLLREWRTRRRLSQFDLAGEVGISTRHLSFVETGRSQPSRDMLLRLAEELNVPLRERNMLLVAGGYAPVFAQRPLDDAALQVAQRAVELVLKGHEPYPALAIDRHWNLIAMNRAVAPLLSAADASLLESPVNVLRLSLHPRGLAPHIVNLAEWRAHLLERLRRQCDTTADPILIALLDELRRFPTPHTARENVAQRDGVIVPLELRTPAGY
jgi:transcriptional regulator with XRE-family HTH domain